MNKLPTYSTNINEKLSYCSTTSNFNLEPFTVPDIFYKVVEKYPNKVAFIFNQNAGLKLTYLELKEKAELLAKNFLNLNIKRGDRIAYLLPNTYQLVICYFAAALIGAVSVPLDADYGSDELEYMLKKTDPKAVILYNCAEYQKMINDLFPELDNSSKEEFKSTKFNNLSQVIVIDNEKQDKFKAAWSYEFISTQLLKSVESMPYVDTDDKLAIIFTSGTTSRPKGVIITHFSILNIMNIFSKSASFPKIDMVYCCTLLMYHVGAMNIIMGCLFHDNISILFPSFKLDNKEIFESIQKYKPTVLSILPKILLNMINDPLRKNYDLSSLAIVGITGQQFSAELILKIKNELSPKVCMITYGLTETILTHNNFIDLSTFKIDNNFSNVGKLYPLTEAKIVNPENGQIQPLNVEGELHIRSCFTTKEYYNDQEMTKKLIDPAGWVNTGDILSMDKDGNFHFKSRSKEVITARGSGRLDVYHSNVEDFILSHQSVIETVVFGVSVNDYEQEICAWVKIKEGCKITSEELIEFCKNRLVDYKVPKYVKFVDEFPFSKLGKYLRHEMEKQYKLELKI